jgi:hypothetical protein
MGTLRSGRRDAILNAVASIAACEKKAFSYRIPERRIHCLLPSRHRHRRPARMVSGSFSAGAK